MLRYFLLIGCFLTTIDGTAKNRPSTYQERFVGEKPTPTEAKYLKKYFGGRKYVISVQRLTIEGKEYKMVLVIIRNFEKNGVDKYSSLDGIDIFNEAVLYQLLPNRVQPFMYFKPNEARYADGKVFMPEREYYDLPHLSS